MKAVSNALSVFTQQDISRLEKEGKIVLELDGEKP